MRGMVNNVLPPASNDHGFRRVSSLDPAIAARAATTFLSNFSSSSLLEATGSSL